MKKGGRTKKAKETDDPSENRRLHFGFGTVQLMIGAVLAVSSVWAFVVGQPVLGVPPAAGGVLCVIVGLVTILFRRMLVIMVSQAALCGIGFLLMLVGPLTLLIHLGTDQTVLIIMAVYPSVLLIPEMILAVVIVILARRERIRRSKQEEPLSFREEKTKPVAPLPPLPAYAAQSPKAAANKQNEMPPPPSPEPIDGGSKRSASKRSTRSAAASPKSGRGRAKPVGATPSSPAKKPPAPGQIQLTPENTGVANLPPININISNVNTAGADTNVLQTAEGGKKKTDSESEQSSRDAPYPTGPSMMPQPTEASSPAPMAPPSPVAPLPYPTSPHGGGKKIIVELH